MSIFNRRKKRPASSIQSSSAYGAGLSSAYSTDAFSGDYSNLDYGSSSSSDSSSSSCDSGGGGGE